MRSFTTLRVVSQATRWSRPTAVSRGRLAVLCAAAVMTVVKVWMAATTYGVDDVWLFYHFAVNVHRYGPIMVYAHPIPGLLPYNHPPLTGWMLDLFLRMSHHGIAFPLLIRLPSIAADAVTALLVYELVRTIRPVGQALVAGLGTALSPVLFVISGYHGNTDPVFVMFTLFSVYLMMRDRWPALAGASFAVGLSIKLVPVVVLPLLLLVAVRAGVRRLAAFLVGGAVVFGVLWGPVVVYDLKPFATSVLMYKGIPQYQWGLVQFGQWLGIPGPRSPLIGSARFLILLVTVLLPLALAWRRPDRTLPAVGLTMMLLLLLSPATSTQYLSWPAACAFLAGVWPAVVYNVVAGAFLVKLYDRWNHAYPWHWRRVISWSSSWRPGEVAFAAVVWAVLLAATVIGFVSWARVKPTATHGADDDGASAVAGAVYRFRFAAFHGGLLRRGDSRHRRAHGPDYM